MRYECGITVIRKKATKECIISGEPLECVSRRKRVTSTVGKIADMSVGNVVRLEDTVWCLTRTGWRKEVGRKRGVDKPLAQRLPKKGVWSEGVPIIPFLMSFILFVATTP